MQTDNKYKVSFPRLIELLLPMGMRTQSFKAVVCAGAKIVETQRQQLLQAMQEDHFRVRHNGQVCYLRAALNKHFAPKDKPFRIREPYGELEWLYANTEEGKNHILANTEEYDKPHIYAPDEVVMNERYSFVVSVPASLGKNEDTMNKIKHFVNEYRLVTRVPLYELY